MTTVSPEEILSFIRAQLDEDERKVAAMEREAERVRTAPIFQGHPPNWLAGVDIFVSPKRWQAEMEAKRSILDRHPGATEKNECPGCGTWLDGTWRTPPGALCPEQVDMASTWSSHPDYRAEWRPA